MAVGWPRCRPYQGRSPTVKVARRQSRKWRRSPCASWRSGWITASRALGQQQRLGVSWPRFLGSAGASGGSGTRIGLWGNGWPDFVFASHHHEEIGPRMLVRIARRTGLQPKDCDNYRVPPIQSTVESAATSQPRFVLRKFHPERKSCCGAAPEASADRAPLPAVRPALQLRDLRHPTRPPRPPRDNATSGTAPKNHIGPYS
jgi:hypothetical protein